jgi:hypothetical protein
MTGKRVSTRAADRLKDEVYRQMLRVEAGRPAAQIPLAVALLQAWMMLEEQPCESEARQWLRTVSPVCVRLIATAGRPR